MPSATADVLACRLLPCPMMDDAISLGLNGKLTLRLVRAAVLAARAGWYPTDLHVAIYEAA